MANIKSSKKRILVNEKKKAQNTMIKSDLRTAIKKCKVACANGDKKLAEALLSDCFAKLDHAASENIIHKNKAANNKATLSKLVASASDVKKTETTVKKAATKAPAKKG